jgi:hypothetical protein
MKKRAVLAILLVNIVSLLIILQVHQAAATVTAVQPADVYTGRTTSVGIIKTSYLSVFGPNICTAYGDPFSPWNSIWAPGSYTYHYRILIPPSYSSDILRVELFDPDSINQAQNTHAVSYSAIAHALDLINFPPGTENKTCPSTSQKNPCLIPTGELSLVNPNGDQPVLLDQINPFWFVRVDENRGHGQAPGDGACGEPSSYDPAFNTTTLYELFYYAQNSDGTTIRTPLANYTGQTGDGVRDSGDHLTDMRWVSPGGTQLYDQPAVVPVDLGSPDDFELSIAQDLTGIVTDPTTGERYVYLDITTLKGASENGFDIWAGPLYPGVPSDVNMRNIQILNNLSVPSAKGVVVSALEYNPVNSNVDFATDIPLTYLDPEQAGQSVYVSLFDPDAGAQPPVVFYLDTVAESDWSLTFGAGGTDPDGVDGRCPIGLCQNMWIDPPYQIQLPDLTSACDPTNPDPQACTPFYGGRLMARYIGGQADTYVWQVNAEEGQPDPTAGCSAFPITVNDQVRSVTPPGTGSNPYPDAAAFDYPAAPPIYHQFFNHVSDVPIQNAKEGYVFKVANGSDPGAFDWLVWNMIYLAGNSNDLAHSLSWPGDSWSYPTYGYYEPGDPTDMSLSLGDYVAKSVGLIGSASVQQALNEHVDLGRVLRLPTWDDDIAGTYHTSGFALFRVLGYSITDEWLLLEFMGWDDSCGQDMVDPESITIDGPVSGLVDASYTFTATIGPVDAVQPSTYTWEATDQETAVHSAGLSDIISFTWSIPGPKTITVTTQNGVSDTHTMTIDPAPADLTIGELTLLSAPPIVANEPVDFQVTISNTGDVDIDQSFFVDVFLDPTAVYSTSIPLDQSSGYVAVGSLGAHTSRVITMTTAGFASEPDPHQVYAMVDSVRQMSEGDETNNIAGPLVVNDVGLPLPLITLVPDCGTGPDVQFTVMGFNWPQNETVNLYWNNALRSIVNTGGSTSFSQTWQILSVADGSYTVIGASPGHMATAVFTIPCPSAPMDVTVSGPTTSLVNATGTFTATVSPLTVTQPFTYTWQATGQPTIVQTGGFTDTVTYTWTITGTKTIRVTVENGVDAPVTTTHTVAVEPLRVYLPVVLREE